MSASKIETCLHESSILKANPLDDPASRKLHVYLPPKYSRKSATRYPVVWVLAPFASWGERLFNLQAWDENIIQRTDRLIAAGKMPPIVMAFPDCFTRYGGSQYINSSAVGNYEDYLIHELVPFVDKEFQTRAASDQRGVMGHSSGGYGALVMGMRHPEIFSAVACHSGDMLFEHCYWPAIPGAVRFWEESGGVEKFIDSFADDGEKGRDWGAALGIVAMSACYSPNADSPLGFDLLCDPRTGEINEHVWDRWKDHDPVRLAPTHATALRSLKLLYFDCGRRDEYNLFLGARALSRALVDAGVHHSYDEHEGGHQRANWRFEKSLPALAESLAQ